VRALDQDLLASLVNCLAAGDVFDDSAGEHGRLCVQFEQMLTTEPFRPLPIREICTTLGVSDEKLRASCRLVLGMGPRRYQLFRRLKSAHTELTRARELDVPNIMERHGFATVHRFVTEYWSAYGEMPSLPSHRRSSRD
jgi:AraC-like DNA-binding protein